MESSIKKIPVKEENIQGSTPLLSSVAVHGGLAYVAGKGARGERDIRKATTLVLDSIEEELKNVGSSMEKVLKVTVFLDDLKEYSAMNEAYRGRFGDQPPVRSTVATYGGIPGDSIIEIDCIAAIE